MTDATADVVAPRRRNGALDLLRVVAAFAVVMHHWAGEPKAVEWAFFKAPQTLYPDIHKIAIYGNLGVHLFFIISGAVIANSAIGRTPRTFLAARAARLIPALAVSSLIVTLLITFSSYSIVQGLAPDQVASGWFLFNFAFNSHEFSGVYWTLFYETKFYLLVAVAMLIFGRLRRETLLTGALLWIGILIFGASTLTGFPAAMLMLDFGPLFAAGMLIGLAEDAKTRKMVAFPLLAITVFVLARPENTQVPELVVLASVIAVMCACWIPQLSFLDRSAIATFGKMTYPIYLLEGAPSLALLRFLTDKGIGREVALLVALAFILVVSYLITRFIDPPAARAIRGWMDPDGRRPSAPIERAA